MTLTGTPGSGRRISVHRSRRLFAAVAVTVAGAGLSVIAPVPAGAAVPALTNPVLNTDGIQVDPGGIVEVPAPLVNGVPRWKGTLLDISMKPSAIWTTVHTRVYLPQGYATSGATRYPSLYLLHGVNETLDAARAWNDPGNGDAGRIVDGSPFKGIVVMPDGGRSGWYTNWLYPDMAGHKLNWQSFHTDQLRGWIDGHFRTINNRSSRAIAGLSMGGHGALSYAAQRPDLFSKVASFSGPGDINDPGVQQGLIANQVTKFASTVPAFGSAIYKSEEGDFSKRAVDAQWVFGTYGGYGWSNRNPYQQAAKYPANNISVSLYSGWGGDNYDIGGSALESQAGPRNDRLHAKFKEHNVKNRYCTGVGAHNWAYWRADLTNWLTYQYGPTTTTPLACPSNWGAPRA